MHAAVVPLRGLALVIYDEPPDSLFKYYFFTAIGAAVVFGETAAYICGLSCRALSDAENCAALMAMPPERAVSSRSPAYNPSTALEITFR